MKRLILGLGLGTAIAYGWRRLIGEEAEPQPSWTGTDNDPEAAMYLAHARQLETEDEWFWPPDAEWWRGYGMGLPDDVLRKVYRANAERLLARTTGP